MKLLLDLIDNTQTIAVVHQIGNTIKRRAHHSAHDALVQYFTYSDAMVECGYTIRYSLYRPYSYDVVCNDRVIERVCVGWS